MRKILALTLIGCTLSKVANCQFKMLADKYINRAPITTSIKDAKMKVTLIDNFIDSSSPHISLNNMPRKNDGKYIITSGLYTLQSKSFCMHAGTYGPTKGDGYLLASLAGPQAYLIQTILENWKIKHPEINQREIQLLIWAIIARTSFKKMNIVHKTVLLKLLDTKDLEKYGFDDFTTGLIDKFWDKIQDKIPDNLLNSMKAEKDLRALYYKADIAYQDFEKIAVLFDSSLTSVK